MAENLRDLFDFRKIAVVKNINQLKRGDHIILNRAFSFHYAIVTDVNKETEQFDVIEIRTDKNQTPVIRPIKSTQKLTRWRKCMSAICRYTYHGVQRNSPDLTVALIEACIAKNDAIKYDMFSNKCYHVAVFCATGYPYKDKIAQLGKGLTIAEQVEKIMQTLFIDSCD
ncbi:uncharacterized protein LOC134236044 [Saccostrea cucullata]|uniref:uncharacterized protein LOC134236044 n=1 Tax=Saccostrea cuccullata TaxID=36930 RepID=UPI002ED69E3A